MFESHFVTPSLIPSGKGIFLSSFQNNSAHLTHIWKPFCQPIRRGFLLQFLTATFATEKRHDFWKNFPSTLYRNFRSRKRHIFRNFFKKCSHPSTARFRAKNGHTFSKKLPALIPQVFSVESKPLFQKFFLYYCYRDICSPKWHTNREKNIKNSACLVFRSRRYIFSGIQL